MKDNLISIIILYLCCINLNAQTSNNENTPWDKALIEDAPIWNKLLVHYANADFEKYWPVRKAALEDIVANYPSSNWADDAALLLAGGKAHIDKDIQGAIKDLRTVIDDYPKENTIVEHWSMLTGFRFSEAWLMWAPSLVSFDDKEKVKKTRAFDSDKNMDTHELELLYYFKHLEKYKNYTKDIAQFTIALLFIEQGDKEGAIVELENLFGEKTDFSKITKCDTDAAKDSNGFLIESVPPYNITPVNRVQYNTVAVLCELYIETDNNDKAFNLLNTFAQESCADGWLWNYNLFCSQMFISLGKLELAENQLNIAEEGLALKIKRTATRQKKLYNEGNLVVSSNFVDWETAARQEYSSVFLQIENLREKIQSAKKT